MTRAQLDLLLKKKKLSTPKALCARSGHAIDGRHVHFMTFSGHGYQDYLNRKLLLLGVLALHCFKVSNILEYVENARDTDIVPPHPGRGE